MARIIEADSTSRMQLSGKKNTSLQPDKPGLRKQNFNMVDSRNRFALLSLLGWNGGLTGLGILQSCQRFF